MTTTTETVGGVMNLHEQVLTTATSQLQVATDEHWMIGVFSTTNNNTAQLCVQVLKHGPELTLGQPSHVASHMAKQL